MPYQEVAPGDGGPANEGIGRGLAAVLSFGHASALVHVRIRLVGQRRCPGTGQLFLYLQEQGVVRPVAEQQHHVVARADTAGAHDLKGDIHRPVSIQRLPPVQPEGVAVRPERCDHLASLLVLHMAQERRLIVKARLAAGAGHRQLGQVPGRGGTLRLLQDFVYATVFGVAMHLVGHEVQDMHGRKAPQGFAVTTRELTHRPGACRVLSARLAVGEDQTRGKAFDIPFPWRGGQGFVKIVQVEDQMPVGRGVGSEVAHVRVAAKLHGQPGHRMAGEVHGHQRSRPAKEAERRSRHPGPLDRQHFGQAARVGGDEGLHRVRPVGRGRPRTLVSPRDDLAAGFAARATLGHRVNGRNNGRKRFGHGRSSVDQGGRRARGGLHFR